ncbi:unnamed protein product [Wuchereria bancrofti]|uniref:Uncharacterized protein n=1 Tax=Wuchereria bancrofti TaxID=6293 RepID=A0A3P7E1M4_WUCBA|nr:unnamed protein product [Wuchereria bancrofti]
MVTGAGRDLVVGKEGGLLVYVRFQLSNGIMSATVPLLLEEDIELGSPPSYKEAVDGERTLQNRSLQRHWFFDFNFGKATANFAPVIFANVGIRLGFLRKVFGILSLQLLITAVFCTALYVTSEIRLFLQQQLWIVFVSLIGSFILLFAMFIHARSVPLNYILLVSWTIMQSITVGAVGKILKRYFVQPAKKTFC